MLHRGSAQRGLMNRCRVGVPGVEEQDTDRAVEDDVVAPPQRSPTAACHLGVEVVAACKSFHCHESTACGSWGQRPGRPTPNMPSVYTGTTRTTSPVRGAWII